MSRHQYKFIDIIFMKAEPQSICLVRRHLTAYCLLQVFIIFLLTHSPLKSMLILLQCLSCSAPTGVGSPTCVNTFSSGVRIDFFMLYKNEAVKIKKRQLIRRNLKTARLKTLRTLKGQTLYCTQYHMILLKFNAKWNIIFNVNLFTNLNVVTTWSKGMLL